MNVRKADVSVGLQKALDSNSMSNDHMMELLGATGHEDAVEELQPPLPWYVRFWKRIAPSIS